MPEWGEWDMKHLGTRVYCYKNEDLILVVQCMFVH